MFCKKEKARSNDRAEGGIPNRKVDEMIDRYVACAQAEFVARAKPSASYGDEYGGESRARLVGVAIAAGFVGLIAGKYVPWNEPPRGWPSEIVIPAPTSSPIKVVTNERAERFEDDKAEPAPKPVAPPVDLAAPASACPQEIAKTAGAMDARRIVAKSVYAGVVPIRVELGSNGSDAVRVSTDVLIDAQGKARILGSKAYAGGASAHVSGIVEPELGGISIAPPQSPCVLNFVNKIRPE